MVEITELLDLVASQHVSSLSHDKDAVRTFELRTGYRLPSDLKAFYERFQFASLQIGVMGPLYRIVPLTEVRQTRIDIYGEDTDEAGPSSWFTICDIQDGNFVAVDLNSNTSSGCNYIDCFHETFAIPGNSSVIAKSFTGFLSSALSGGSNQLFFLQEGFTGFGDALLGNA